MQSAGRQSTACAHKRCECTRAPIGFGSATASAPVPPAAAVAPPPPARSRPAVPRLIRKGGDSSRRGDPWRRPPPMAR